MKNENTFFFLTNFPNEFLNFIFHTSHTKCKKNHYALILGFKNNKIRRINDYYE